MNRAKLKIRAKKSIKGKVFFSFLVVLAYGVIQGIASSLVSIGGENSKLAILGGVLSLIVSVLLYPLRYGVVFYFKEIANGKKGNFDGFLLPYKEKFAWEMMKAYLIKMLYVTIGFILFVIPGIYFLIKFSQLEYVFLENKEIKSKEALDKSGEIMKGNYWEYIVLILSFFGWFLLGVISIGLLFIYILPYIEATFLQFFYEKADKHMEIEKVENMQDAIEKIQSKIN